jgi:alpha-tubulin suppressor-like RCC1 family protein
MVDTFRYITSTHRHSYAITTDRRLLAAGDLTDHQPDSLRVQPHLPWTDTGLGDATQVATSDTRTVAVTADGRLWGTGMNDHQNMSVADPHLTTWTDLGLNDVVGVAVGSKHTVAVTADGTLYGAGHNRNRALTAHCIPRSTWTALQHNVTAVSTSNRHTLILVDGVAYGVGGPHAVELGIGSRRGQVGDWTELGLSNIVRVLAVHAGSFAIDTDGVLHACGSLTTGPTGGRAILPVWTALTSNFPHRVVDIIGGGTGHPTLMIADNGHLYHLDGSNGTVTLRDTGLTGIISAAASWQTQAAVDINGRLHLCGRDSDGTYGYPEFNSDRWITIPTDDDTDRTFAALVADGIPAADAAATARALHTTPH